MKIVVVGDGAVGKTCLLVVYAHPSNEFPDGYVPTIFDNYNCDVEINSKVENLSLWDTAGQEEYDELRPMSYNNTDVFIVCYSVVSKNSYRNVIEKWMPELRTHAKDPKKLRVILCGTKTDLRRNDQNGTTTSSSNEFLENEEDNNAYVEYSKKDGMELAKRIKAYKYIECSAKLNEGVKEVFDQAIICHLNKGKRENSGCIIL